MCISASGWLEIYETGFGPQCRIAVSNLNVYSNGNLILTRDRDPVCHHYVPPTSVTCPASCHLDAGDCFLKGVKGSE
jgi:hypothetical protein